VAFGKMFLRHSTMLLHRPHPEGSLDCSGQSSLYVRFSQLRHFEQVPQQPNLERLIAMDRHRKSNDAAWPAVDKIHKYSGSLFSKVVRITTCHAAQRVNDQRHINILGIGPIETIWFIRNRVIHCSNRCCVTKTSGPRNACASPEIRYYVPRPFRYVWRSYMIRPISIYTPNDKSGKPLKSILVETQADGR